MRIFIPAMGRVNTKNRDGSEVRFSEIARRWLAWGQELVVMLPRRQIGVFESQNVRGMDYRVFPEPFEDESDSLGNVLRTYLWRLFRCLFVSYPKGMDAIYAPSDFLVDLLPALLAKLRNPEARLTVCVFLIAPNPFRGYENMFRPRWRVPTVRGLLYWSTQMLALALTRAFGGRMLVLNSLDRDTLLARGVAPEAVQVVTMGVDMGEFTSVEVTPETPRYDGIFLGRLHPQKGLFDLVKIWRAVCDARPGARLGIIGGGGDDWFRRLQAEIAAAGLSANVDLLGFRQGAEKVRLLKNAGCFCMPSHYESFGQVAVEAMACGLPVVAYDLPIYDEIFTGGMDRVLQGDVAGFASRVLTLLEGGERRARLVEEAAAVSARFDWEAIARAELERVG
ncbi:Phosphatidyl-myo-inositol mannosyltransferase [Fundidesulfovibrio magnetotacticus]|uniref:Phosphatidyl-myo-inositol mannosyltransferase n=1 Tax=Fundidesulfovibrio magnetotacticus TaxID=2730080 RepID=A0A6V8LUP6_9BACT|nr:glycosyltransferase [Fundidesulfovibrio magnetotacticus]GFK94680.1 Phosphatidyl-myo-inositol mannosyltransferase [Fundidesulfovibrio magnetotacticus]